MVTIGTDVTQAIHLLLHGQTVAIPTETVYGLAANACDANAVGKVFKIKQRPPPYIHSSYIPILY